MSTPEATGIRQRSKVVNGDEDVKVSNPASLSGNPGKKVPRNKPHVKPPFIDMSMNKFLTYLALTLLTLASFYVWRLTVWAADVGGYWNLMTGRRTVDTGIDTDSIVQAAASATQSSAGKGVVGGKSGGEDVQSQIFKLASALGIKPAELSAAIRPLVDPSVPNPIEAVKREADLLRQQMEQQAQTATPGPGVLDMLGEALLD
ncbi:hypothetical protein M231_02579 [Tremella mesenterica]|uniref:Uncharacterized protein n=1 Tax=Tremella mesenterica TaxID=5217 RepID=A0A4Q1BQN2_TREME|nr:uncharacterized protein TREMEDRAFT_71377 [Tremella mesenterica DSM 1558]EIW70766.1 hypothetical protein TREMEDRAFT_71377 [Tremella mesenterica DSM 1558]RXK40122.1 hypothetical protein M231_02579 [Tremella mesenterica]